MAKKTLTNLFEICENVWNEVDSFCGDVFSTRNSCL